MTERAFSDTRLPRPSPAEATICATRPQPEDYDAVLKIDKNDKTSVYVSNAKGVGSLSMDRQGRLFGVHRTERPGSTKPDQASIVNAITILAPARKMVADKWADGTTLSVRPNDLAADSQGGAYFTSGCVYYASATAFAPRGPGSVATCQRSIRSFIAAITPSMSLSARMPSALLPPACQTFVHMAPAATTPGIVVTVMSRGIRCGAAPRPG